MRSTFLTACREHDHRHVGLRNSRKSSKPFMPGIITSRMTAQNVPVSAREAARSIDLDVDLEAIFSRGSATGATRALRHHR
jgi:hypothetical protein